MDYLVGPEAFETTTPVLMYRDELKDRVVMGVIDLLAVPDDYPALASELAVGDVSEVHVISVEGLILRKLAANRTQEVDVNTALRHRGGEPGDRATSVAGSPPPQWLRW